MKIFYNPKHILYITCLRASYRILQSSRLAQGKGSNPLKVLIKENKSDLSNV